MGTCNPDDDQWWRPRVPEAGSSCTHAHRLNCAFRFEPLSGKSEHGDHSYNYTTPLALQCFVICTQGLSAVSLHSTTNSCFTQRTDCGYRQRKSQSLTHPQNYPLCSALLTMFHPTHPVSPHSPCFTSHTMFHLTHHVSPHTPCFTSLTMFHYTHHVSPHSPCFISLTMFHYTHHVSPHTPCFTSLTMFHLTHHVSPHSPCFIPLTLFHLIQYVLPHSGFPVIQHNV